MGVDGVDGTCQAVGMLLKIEFESPSGPGLNGFIVQNSISTTVDSS